MSASQSYRSSTTFWKFAGSGPPVQYRRRERLQKQVVPSSQVGLSDYGSTKASIDCGGESALVEHDRDRLVAGDRGRLVAGDHGSRS